MASAAGHVHPSLRGRQGLFTVGAQVPKGLMVQQQRIHMCYEVRLLLHSLEYQTMLAKTRFFASFFFLHAHHYKKKKPLEHHTHCHSR
jgi:hypothetical protein